MVKYISTSIGFLLLVSLVACGAQIGGADSPQRPEVTIFTQTPPQQPQPEIEKVESSSGNTRPQANALPEQVFPESTDPNLSQSGTAAEAKPCNLAAAGIPLDITYPDNIMTPGGEEGIKTWRLVNAGSCDWTADYAIVWFSGDKLSPTLEEPLGRLVKPGDMVDISVDFVAPEETGTYQSNWKLRSPTGDLFGLGPNGDAAFWIRIQTIIGATPTASAEQTATPAPEVYASGLVVLSLNKSVDLDQTGGDSSEVADLGLLPYENSPSQWMLAAQNQAHLAYFGTATPTITECQTIGLSESSFFIREADIGGTLCYRTGQGLPGYLRIKSIDLPANSITLEYVTWLVP